MHLALEIVREAFAPDFLAVGDLQADQIAVGADGVDQIAIDRRRAARARCSRWAPRLADPGLPQFVAAVEPRANTHWASSRSPMVKMRPRSIVTLENPPPSPSCFQASGGPSSGHCFNRPVSGEMSSRLGPRHWGQNGDVGRLGAAVDGGSRPQCQGPVGQIKPSQRGQQKATTTKAQAAESWRSSSCDARRDIQSALANRASRQTRPAAGGNPPPTAAACQREHFAKATNRTAENESLPLGAQSDASCGAGAA